MSSHRTVEFGVLGTYLVSGGSVVTAPVWLASPPEVHSALLRLVRGRVRCRRPRVDALSAEYAAVAQELSVVVAAVGAGVAGSQC